jgi:nitrite reductase/ring-hydroxylating ferredoxin subunit
MGIFRRKAPADAEGFVETAVIAADVQPDQMKVVKVNGREVILTRCDDQLYAFSNDCPHAAAALSGGTLHRWKVCCPDHGYCFDIRNGRLTWPPDEPYRLQRYAVKVENGRVKIKLE